MWTAKNRGRYDRSMRWLRLSEQNFRVDSRPLRSRFEGWAEL